MPKAVTQTQTSAQLEEKDAKLLFGFRDLIAERTGYAFGVRVLSEELREATKDQRKAVNEARKNLKQNLETYIKNADIDGYKSALALIKERSAELKKASEGTVSKINKLRRAIRFIDNVMTPAFLNQMGVTVLPLREPKSWVEAKIQEVKEAKKKQLASLQ